MMDFELEATKFYSCEEVAQYLGLDPVTVRRHCRDGSLPSVRLGEQGNFRIRGREILVLEYQLAEKTAREFARKMGWDVIEEETMPESLKDVPEDLRGRIISMCKVAGIALEEVADEQLADLVEVVRSLVVEEQWQTLEEMDRIEAEKKAREQASESQHRQTLAFALEEKRREREIGG